MKKLTRQRVYDRCRAVGHSWYEVDADRPPAFGYYFWVQCDCGTIRKDILNRHGQLLNRSYEYEDDYKDTEKFTRSDYRLRLISHRVLPETEEVAVWGEQLVKVMNPDDPEQKPRLPRLGLDIPLPPKEEGAQESQAAAR